MENTLIKRIIPCLDVTNGRVVKGTNFVNLRDAGDPVELARFYDQEGADELVLLDITASSEARKTMLDVVTRTAKEVSIPFIVGGGINDIEAISNILKAGADKVSINTAAIRTPELITAGVKTFGSQRIIVAVDVKKIGNHWEVVTLGGKTLTGLDALEWLKKMESLGAGEILLTSMDRDGTKIGYDTELLAEACRLVKIPVIASGGAGKIEHVEEALKICSAALLASLLHFREITIKETKEYLISKGVPVRKTW